DRFKVSMKGDGFDHNIIEAVAGDELQGNLFEMKLKLEQISSILSTDQGQDFVSAAKRAISILESEEKKDKKTYDGSVSEQTLQEAEEKNLYSALEKVMPEVEKQISEKNFGSAMSSLATVRETVDLFFDKVVVNDNNAEIRANRLALLSRIRSCVNKIADFSRL
ncbi:MAG TPA: DALR anticodon-binding domain-containing protein, partial [Alphaproteobacteria bacterium]|nr:DALR anticodon-binding domain-containing protein [Alphaproteobacteria bacterium]